MRKSFVRAYLRQKWIDLRQTKTKMITGAFYISSNTFHNCAYMLISLVEAMFEKQVSAWPDGRCDMRSSRTTDYHKNEAFPLITTNLPDHHRLRFGQPTQPLFGNNITCILKTLLN